MKYFDQDCFMAQAAQGHATAEDMPRYTKDWHDNDYGDQPLHHFLGMTAIEYALVVETPQILPRLIELHRKHLYGLEPHMEDIEWAKHYLRAWLDNELKKYETTSAETAAGAERVRKGKALKQFLEKVIK